jgi:hypothetical protein
MSRPLAARAPGEATVISRNRRSPIDLADEKPVMPLNSYIFPPGLRLLLAATIALSLVIARNEAHAAQSVRLPSDGERVTYRPSSHVRVVPDVVFAR